MARMSAVSADHGSWMGLQASVDPTVVALARGMPKVELHAHLNGSISRAMLQELATEKGQSWNLEQCMNMKECFKIFDVVHNLVTDESSLYRATTSVIQDFANDGVKVLELRTTPRDTGLLDRDKYLDTVLLAIQDWAKAHSSPRLRLLVSLNRSATLEESQANMAAAEKARASCPHIVVGYDLSGDPSKGNLAHVQSLLSFLDEGRRKLDMKATLHVAEIPSQGEEECRHMLGFRPDRLGHATFLCDMEELWNQYRQVPVPVEVCISSNVMTGTIGDMMTHHVKKFNDIGLPYAISTDDAGVFGTCLSREYELASVILSWTPQQLHESSASVIQWSFLTSKEKEEVMLEFDQWWKKEGNAIMKR